ncbi:hypothetical protein [Hymenobacter tenuis]
MKNTLALFFKFVLIIALSFINLMALGQNQDQADNKILIPYKVIKQFEKNKKVYTPSGKYNVVLDWETIGDCALRIEQYAAPVMPDSKSYQQDRASFIIDMSRVTRVRSGTTNFGYKCIAIDGKGAIISSMGIRRLEGGFEWTNPEITSSITIAVDNEELEELFTDWMINCKGEKSVDFDRYLKSAPVVAEYKEANQSTGEVLLYVLVAIATAAFTIISLK